MTASHWFLPHVCVFVCLCGRGKLIKCRTVVAKFVGILLLQELPTHLTLSPNHEKSHPKKHPTENGKNIKNFTLIWLNGFIDFDICSFVDPIRSLNFILILFLWPAFCCWNLWGGQFLGFPRPSKPEIFHASLSFLPFIFFGWFLSRPKSNHVKPFLCLRWQKSLPVGFWYVNHILCFIFCASTIRLPTLGLLGYLSAVQKGVKSGPVCRLVDGWADCWINGQRLLFSIGHSLKGARQLAFMNFKATYEKTSQIIIQLPYSYYDHPMK